MYKSVRNMKAIGMNAAKQVFDALTRYTDPTEELYSDGEPQYKLEGILSFGRKSPEEIYRDEVYFFQQFTEVKVHSLESDDGLKSVIFEDGSKLFVDEYIPEYGVPIRCLQKFGLRQEDKRYLINFYNKQDFHFFRVELSRSDNTYEDVEEYKKLGYHFDWLIGKTSYCYSRIGVIPHLRDTDSYIAVIGLINAQKEEFDQLLKKNAQENYGFDINRIVMWRQKFGV